jgi:hypothetical protein
MPAVHVDFANHPNLRFRIDSFSVPAAARGEFDATMKRNLVFIEKLPGFHGHYCSRRRVAPRRSTS